MQKGNIRLKLSLLLKLAFLFCCSFNKLMFSVAFQLEEKRMLTETAENFFVQITQEMEKRSFFNFPVLNS